MAGLLCRTLCGCRQFPSGGRNPLSCARTRRCLTQQRCSVWLTIHCCFQRSECRAALRRYACAAERFARILSAISWHGFLLHTPLSNATTPCTAPPMTVPRIRMCDRWRPSRTLVQKVGEGQVHLVILFHGSSPSPLIGEASSPLSCVFPTNSTRGLPTFLAPFDAIDDNPDSRTPTKRGATCSISSST
jgi:hypothetical protein